VQTDAAELVAGGVVHGDYRPPVMFQQLAGAGKRFILGAEALEPDAVLLVQVAARHRQRIAIKDTISHASPPYSLKTKKTTNRRFHISMLCVCCLIGCHGKVRLLMGQTLAALFGTGVTAMF
jgi:hypothetical protein